MYKIKKILKVESDVVMVFADVVIDKQLSTLLVLPNLLTHATLLLCTLLDFILMNLNFTKL